MILLQPPHLHSTYGDEKENEQFFIWGFKSWSLKNGNNNKRI